jgi:hypothetical protein
MTNGSWTRRRRQVFPSTRPRDRNRRYRHRAKQRLCLAGRSARLGRLRRSPRLVRGTVDAELSPNPCAEAPYQPNAADMTAVAELVLAALTADHRGTSA